MPAHYDLKAIGDQVHRLTMQLEAEKLMTELIFRRLARTGALTPKHIEAFIDNLPQGKDKEGDEFAALLHARALDIYSIVKAPPST